MDGSFGNRDESAKIAAEIENAELRRRLADAERMIDDLSARVDRAMRAAEEAKRIAEDAEDAAEDGSTLASDDGDGGAEAGDGGHLEEMLEDPPIRGVVEDMFLYKVMESNGGVYCFLPKSHDEDPWEGSDSDSESDSDGDSSDAKDLFGGPFGGATFGSPVPPRGSPNAAPYPDDGGGISGLDMDSRKWAHFSWYRVGDASQDCMVVAEFKYREVDGVCIYGLEDIKVVPTYQWRQACSASFSGVGASEIASVPIAHVANGLVTQIQFGPPTEFLKPDCRVLLDGGNVVRRDRSLELVPDRTAVMRLWNWNDAHQDHEIVDDDDSNGVYDVLTDNKHKVEDDDMVRFLVRVPIDRTDPTKGSTLKYFKLTRFLTTDCEGGSDSDSDSDSDGGAV